MNSDYPSGRTPESSSDDTIELFGLLRRRRKLLIGTFLLGLTAAIGYQLFATRLYEARLELMLMRRDSSVPANGVGTQSEVDGSSLTNEPVSYTHLTLPTIYSV